MFNSRNSDLETNDASCYVSVAVICFIFDMVKVICIDMWRKVYTRVDKMGPFLINLLRLGYGWANASIVYMDSYYSPIFIQRLHAGGRYLILTWNSTQRVQQPKEYVVSMANLIHTFFCGTQRRKMIYSTWPRDNKILWNLSEFVAAWIWWTNYVIVFRCDLKLTNIFIVVVKMIISNVIDQMTAKWLNNNRQDYVYGKGELSSTWQR